jgi:hypothetical protein
MKSTFRYNKSNSLEVDLLGRAHGGLDVKHLDVLPVLLQQRDKEVNSELHVKAYLDVGHGDVGNGKGHAHNLLHLELDGGLDNIDLILDVVVIVKKGRELTSLGKPGSEDTGDLLDKRAGGKEGIVLLGELLDELLVLVELLEVLDVHGVNAKLLGSLAMSLVTEDADVGDGLGGDGQLEGTGETFVALGIIVLQGDLQLDGLGEFTLLALHVLAVHGDALAIGELQDVLHRVGEKLSIEFAHF